ncbi:MAG: ATP synthase A1 subunit C [Anaerosomatales bacterium]|nr:ATP synthase A1 subunit C [Anaerosomatales bacterium]MDT8434366.1 ATP synthase A1 subunit C [Anaerosomatales bacterium]
MSVTTTSSRNRSPASPKDYGYANARIRGMRSRLLSRTFLDGLIAEQSVQHLVQEMDGTEYTSDLEDALIHGIDATSVDAALRNNMVHTFQKIMSFLNAEAEYLVTTLLGRWDIFNLKTILRAKHMHLPLDELKDGLLPAGQLTPVDLEALAAADDVRTVVDIAVTWGLPMASALREGHAEFMRTGELASLELALDRYYSEWAKARLSRRGANMRMARKVLATQVDVANLVMVLRLQSADIETIDVDQYFLEGGADITRELYMVLSKMSDIDEVLERLRGTPYGRALDEVSIKYLEQNSISVFERALEDLFMRRTLGIAKGDPLGIGVAVSYLWAKQNEITNLRIIVKGKAVGMPEDRVREELILV